MAGRASAWHEALRKDFLRASVVERRAWSRLVKAGQGTERGSVSRSNVQASMTLQNNSQAR